jgi:flap endonuclease-1
VGVRLAPLLVSETQNLASLVHRRLAIDGTHVIIAALRKIRPDGQPLANRWGEPLAPVHVVFFKSLRLLELGIRPLYVFDGIPPSEKRVRDDQQLTHLQGLWKAYEAAREKDDIQRVHNLFRSAALVYRKALADAVELLRAMGVPAMIAPSEGEAQGAQLVQAGQADALYTPDYDALLFGCPTVVHSLDLARGQVEVLRLDAILHALDLTRAQLVDLGILVGTDFNPGVPQVGPKRALHLLHKFAAIERIPGIEAPPDLEQLRALFLTPTVSRFETFWLPPNVEMCRSLLVQKGFSPSRADRAHRRLLNAYRAHQTSQQVLLPQTETGQPDP